MGEATPNPWEHAHRGEFRSRFDEDPAAYERTRPVAPAPVFDDVVRLAGLGPGAPIVEIGPGTGQATRPLAERGLRVLALEIGPELAARARHNLAGFPEVTVLTSSFEAWDAGGESFDAVVACNSLHWVDPDVRFAKAAAVLRPSGHVIALNTPVVVPDGASRFWWDVQDDWAAAGADRIDPATKHPDLVSDWGPAARASGLFQEPQIIRRPFDISFTAEEYAVNLSTQSGVKALPPDARAELLTRVRRRVEAEGGRLTVHHLAVLTVAKRATARP